MSESGPPALRTFSDQVIEQEGLPWERHLIFYEAIFLELTGGVRECRSVIMEKDPAEGVTHP